MGNTTMAFEVDDQIKERFLRLAETRNCSVDDLFRDLMREFVEQESDPAYDAWFREQVQIGLDQVNQGQVISSEEVEAEFAARRAETQRQLRRGQK
jgi:predicted transcriptional regulator